MAVLSAWKFPSPSGADEAMRKLNQLESEGLLTVVDAAVVSWPEGKKKPRTRQLHSPTASGAVGGTFWGMLLGLIFFVPLLGAAVGAASGALAGSLTDVGISDKFIREVREKITEGTSALFLLSEDAVRDRLVEEFKGTDMELIHTNLSSEQEAQVRQAFAEE